MKRSPKSGSGTNDDLLLDVSAAVVPGIVPLQSPVSAHSLNQQPSQGSGNLSPPSSTGKGRLERGQTGQSSNSLSWRLTNALSAFWKSDDFVEGDGQGSHDLAPRLLRDKKVIRRRHKRAPFYPREFFLGTRLGQYCMLGCVCCIAISSGSLTWAAIGGTSELPPTFKSSLWISWGLFFDPGTQTGMDPVNHPPRVLWTTIIFSILGYWLMLTNMGMVVEVTRGQLTLWEKEHSRVRAEGHILILGWTEKTIFFIKELLHEAHDRGIKKQSVVILADADEIAMRQSIDDFLPQSRYRCCKGSSMPFKFVCRKGCPHDPKELEKVSVATAQDIIVLGEAGASRESDLQVARVILALASLPGELFGRVLAEVRCADTSPVLEAILLSHVEGIHARSTVNRMLCLMACKPVVGDCLATFSSWTTGEEMYCVRVPDLEGSTFFDACRFFDKALCIGIRPKSERVILGPPDERVIESTDKLVLIAATEDSIDGAQPRRHEYRVHDRAPFERWSRHCFKKCSWCCRKKRRWKKSAQTFQEGGKTSTTMSFIDVTGSAVQAGARVMKRISDASGTITKKITDVSGRSTSAAGTRRTHILTGAPWENEVDLIGSREAVQPDVLSLKSGSGRVFVIIGWTEDFKDFLQTLDLYVRHGCEVHVLADMPIAEQEACLDKASLVNIKVKHHSGSLISVDRVSELPLAQAHSILVLAPSGGSCNMSDAFGLDSSTVACAALICSISEGCYGRERMCKLSGRIICEVLDPRTERMLEKNQDLRRKVKFFKSNALETGLFAMATSEPMVFNILVLLLCPTHDIGKLVGVGVSSYLSQEEEQILHRGDDTCRGDGGLMLSYWQLHERVRGHEGELLIGWHRSEERITKLGANLNKFMPVRWSTRDRLLVIKNNTGVPAIVDRIKRRPSANVDSHTLMLGPWSPISGCDDRYKVESAADWNVVVEKHGSECSADAESSPH